jgi:hypothetical protein
VVVPSQTSSEPFAAYHRARRTSAIARAAALGIPGAALIATLVVLTSLAPTSAAAAGSENLAAIGSGTAVATPTPTTAAAPSPTGSSGPRASVRSALTRPGATSESSIVRVRITADGYQHEIDECQWVRMDLDAEAPIVGAHTQCGGSVVLSLRPGDRVELTGEGLDGDYLVTDGRDAHAGDNAATATQGMLAEVILQTCYPGAGGRERLIGLEPQS